MPSFLPFCTSCTKLEQRRKGKKGDEKTLRSEQFKTQFLHRQSAIQAKRRKEQKIAKKKKKMLFKNKQQEIHET